MSIRSLLAAFVLVLAACGGSSPTPPSSPGTPSGPVKVTLLLNWTPDAQHGGYYAAHVKGFFREAGLEVDILPNTDPNSVVPRVATGQVDFGVVNADRILMGRANDAPVVAIMAPLQNSPRCVMVHAGSEITDFSQLNKLKVIALSTGPAENVFLTKKIDLSGVEIVRYQGNVQRFLIDGQTYGQQAYSISEPFRARAEGADPRCLMVSTLGYNPYVSVLVASEKTLAERPDVARKLVAASVRGWKEYMTDYAATNGQIHSANKEMSLDILEFGAKELRPLVDIAGGPIGRMSLERWQTLAKQLEEIGEIKPGVVDPSKAFSTAYLPDGK